MQQSDDLDLHLRQAFADRPAAAAGEDLLGRIRAGLPDRPPAIRTGASLGEWLDMTLLVTLVGLASVAIHSLATTTPLAAYVALSVIMIGLLLFAGSIARTLLDRRSFIRRAPLAIWRHPPQVAGLVLVAVGFGLHIV